MKRTKRLTKREKKALDPGHKAGPNPSQQQAHIHCVACGRHIDPDEFTGPPATATWITCDHGSQFASCVTCIVQAETLVAAHDRTGNPIKAAAAWH
jgi:hypothetical protein